MWFRRTLDRHPYLSMFVCVILMLTLMIIFTGCSEPPEPTKPTYKHSKEDLPQIDRYRHLLNESHIYEDGVEVRIRQNTILEPEELSDNIGYPEFIGEIEVFNGTPDPLRVMNSPIVKSGESYFETGPGPKLEILPGGKLSWMFQATIKNKSDIWVHYAPNNAYEPIRFTNVLP